MAIGVPMVIKSSVFEIFFIADHIVVSVGPYMFQSSFALSNMLFANTNGKASPVDIALIFKGSSHPEYKSICQVAGVACIIVTASSFIRFSNKRVSLAVSSLVNINLAPINNGANNSTMAISNETVVIEISVSVSFIPGFSSTL